MKDPRAVTIDEYQAMPEAERGEYMRRMMILQSKPTAALEKCDWPGVMKLADDIGRKP